MEEQFVENTLKGLEAWTSAAGRDLFRWGFIVLQKSVRRPAARMALFCGVCCVWKAVKMALLGPAQQLHRRRDGFLEGFAALTRRFYCTHIEMSSFYVVCCA